MRTQSPFTGISSASSPSWTLRRTPVTSTMPTSLWPSAISTIFSGMAKHIAQLPPQRYSFTTWRVCRSFLFARDHFEGELQLVFYFERATGHRDGLDAVVGLIQGEFAGRA